MNNIFNVSVLTFFIIVTLQSCDSNDDFTSYEQVITTDLANKVITTASSINDYNFFVNNAANSSCSFIQYTWGYFNNPEGDYYEFTLGPIESLDMWLKEYEDAKTDALKATGIQFSNEDFFIKQLNNPSGFAGISERESILEYFEYCYLTWTETSVYSVPFSDISINCDSNATIYFWLFDENGKVDSFEGIGLNSLDGLLTDYNLDNNTNYSNDNIRIGSVTYTSNNEELWLRDQDDLMNYFENCMLSRDTSESDCLNFVYPLQVNRTNKQIDDVITLENDEDLVTTFNTNADELTFIFPIKLLGADGTHLIVESNDNLENAIDNSVDYCY
ncbi:hypothetical protein APS56_13375 [Pseudalgibacter alginicilyticus]|uniref:Uncharacterized protein n=1 Tax=Pseudalgibacter alginicilyticus TaxID=1736674 RepID=A0A0P0DD24_9FLAO|nr:hypothetical protein [Pseudalgibacter alginicilyticus]ALJ06060.1 hypothetical protein APS56_13375 [Pseudalgibacter alginicilyticus]